MTLKMYLSRQLLSTLSFLLFFPLLSFSQTVEDCNNGVDDDGDGLIDCYDQDCTCTGQCDDFYYTTCNADCYYIPPCGQISLGIQWTGQAETGTYSTLVAGDMDHDGIPDIVTYRVENPNIYIIDGATGATKVEIICPSTLAGGTAPAIADLDHDGFGEIVIVANDLHLYCYEHDGTLKYVSPGIVGYNVRYAYSVPNIADFDHDGWAEVNIGNQVFNGQTGALLASGGPGLSAGEHPARIGNGFSFCSPVAMDVLPDNFCPDCDGLEIVAGNQVMSVNLVTGVVAAVVTAPPPFTDGYTSVADFDGDGDLDAIVQGRRGSQNTVYCWDIQTPTILRQFQLLNNWFDGASRVNIADLNGDGKLEISFVGYPRLYALKNDFTIMWTRPTTDVSSITCSSVFDFCGDGSADVVYRGQTHLQILNGATGQVSWQDDCLSATHIENPLILDVDADGQTEVVIECGTNGSSNTGTVVAYEAVGTPGIASRQVWNQHAYFNTNINDDLSVPRYQQNPHIIGDSLRMNTFLNQFFNPTFPSPDGVLTLQNVVCDRDSLVLSGTLCNIGDNLLPPQTPISAYQGNPQTGAAVWIGAVPIGFPLQKDSCRSFVFRIPRIANDSVFLVLNDDHSIATPFDLAQDFPSTAIGECGFLNNIAAFRYDYNPTPVQLGPDTAICANTTITFNAAGTDLVSWLWQDGSSASSFTAQQIGQYAVNVTDICGNIQMDSVEVTIDSSTIVNIGPDQAICEGETIGLSESGFDNYNWSPGIFVDCNTCAAVTVSPISSLQVVLRAGFENGCVNRDTMFLTVYDTFNIQIDTTICFGRTVQWADSTIFPNQSQTFYFQSIHGCDSTVTVHVHGTTIGTFNITVDTSVCLGSTLSYNGFDLMPGEEKIFNLTAITGCDSTVLVRVAPRDTFYTTENQTICSGESLDVFGIPRNVSGVFSMVFAAQNGCDSTHVVYLTVLDPIILEIDSTPSCPNETTGEVSLTVSGSAPPFAYTWDIPGAPTGPRVENLPAGSYQLTVTDANDCTVNATAIVSAYPDIVFDAAVDSVRCFGEMNGSITLTTADTTLLFSLNEANFSTRLNFPNLPAADYTIYSQDVYGCIDTLPLSVGQPPQRLISLPADTAIILGDSLQIEVQTSGFAPARYIWNDTTYLSCSDCPNPVASPLTSYLYRLTVADENGCQASDEFLLTVQRIIQAYVPNIINLNSQQDANRRFTLNFGPAVRKVNLLQIFDRWGNMVHEVHNALPEDTTNAWEGTHDGKLALPGVYVWILELELVDGTVEKMRGDVTVLR